jgi:hypothetical protein
VDAHSPNNSENFKQNLSACQKADDNCFLGQEMSAHGGIRGITDNKNIRNLLRNIKTLPSAIRNKRHGILTSGVVFFQNNARPHTAARTRALLEHLNWELFDHSPYRPDFSPSDYHLFTYVKNWLGSQCFNNNELTEGVKT